MSAFRVGQRVRIVRALAQEYNGLEAIYVSHSPMLPARHAADCTIRIPGLIGRDGSDLYNARSAALEPLTDPLADQFIERLEKLGREPAIVPASQPEKVNA